MNKIYIEGTITLDDNEQTKVKFDICNFDQSWNQWGNVEDKLYDTMGIVETLDSKLKENYFHYEEEE